MVNLQKSGDSAVKIVFTDSDHYLYGNGEIEVPVNSLLLVIDDSEMVTFKKISGDPFLSFRADNSNLGTKAAIEQFYKENMVGSTGGGGDVTVDPTLDSGSTNPVANSAITTALDAKQDALSAGTNISIDTANTINCTLPIVDWGNNNIAFTDKGYGSGNHTLSFGDGATTPSNYSMSLGNFTNARGNYSVAIGYGGRTNANFSNAFGYYTVTNNERETAQGVYNNSVSSSSTFGDSGNTLFSVGNGTSTSARHNAFEIRQNGDIYIALNGQDVKLQDQLGGGGGMDDDTQQLISTAFNDLNDRKADLTELSKYQKKGDYVKTSTLSSTLSDYMTNASFDEYATAKERIISGALNDLDNRMIAVESGGSVTVDTTLDSGSTNPVQNAVITQALNAKADTSAITTAITSGSTDSEIPTAKATYDAIQAGGGGGATYSAGTNISIDTANTINCTLNMRNGTGADSLIIGDSECSATRAYSIAVGHNADAVGTTSIVIGSNSSSNAGYSFVHGTNCTVYDSNTNAKYCFIFGNQIKNIKQSYNTAFGENLSLGNRYETSFGAYNNSVTGSTASGQTLFSVGNGTSSARHNAFEIRQNGDIYVNDGTNDVKLQDTITATTANTTALGGLKLVKLTQTEYDALATKDSSTLYIISD